MYRGKKSIDTASFDIKEYSFAREQIQEENFNVTAAVSRDTRTIYKAESKVFSYHFPPHLKRKKKV